MVFFRGALFALFVVSHCYTEARGMTRNELARMLGQNGGFRQEKLRSNKHHTAVKKGNERKHYEGVDVQPAKGKIFSSLGEVAEHLRTLGVKIETPGDTKMAAVLNQYGVLKHSKDIRGQHQYHHGKIKPYVDRRKNTNTKDITRKKFEDKIYSRPLFRQEKLQLKPKAKLQFAFG